MSKEIERALRHCCQQIYEEDGRLPAPIRRPSYRPSLPSTRTSSTSAGSTRECLQEPILQEGPRIFHADDPAHDDEDEDLEKDPEAYGAYVQAQVEEEEGRRRMEQEDDEESEDEPRSCVRHGLRDGRPKIRLVKKGMLATSGLLVASLVESKSRMRASNRLPAAAAVNVVIGEVILNARVKSREDQPVQPKSKMMVENVHSVTSVPRCHQRHRLQLLLRPVVS